MARIRQIHPSVWTDEAFSSCSVNARLLYLATVSLADDDGRMSASPVQIRLMYRPADGRDADKDVTSALDELSQHGLITLYEVKGKRFLEVKNFAHYQALRWKVPSKFPAPDSADSAIITKCAEKVCGSTPKTFGGDSLSSHLSDVVVVVEGGPGETPPNANSPNVNTLPAPAPRQPEVEKLFAVYLEATGRRATTLTDKAAARLSEMLAWAGSVEAAERGIRKVGASAHHRGHNEQRKRYDGLDDKPFRTAEAFRGWCEEPIPAPPQGAHGRDVLDARRQQILDAVRSVRGETA